MSKLYPSKAILRQRQRQLRRDLGTQEHSALDQAICQHLLNLIAAHKPRLVAAYSAFDGEPDITPVCRHLADSDVALALPVISASPMRTMVFKQWQPDLLLQRSAFGNLEPQGTVAISPTDIDILIIPLVAYDRHGNRLGMGAGYYDRYLGPFKNSPRPLRVGAAYGIQEVDQIDSDDWDIPLHGVVNEHGWLACNMQAEQAK